MIDIIETEPLCNDEMLAILGGRKEESVQVCAECPKVAKSDLYDFGPDITIIIA